MDGDPFYRFKRDYADQIIFSPKAKPVVKIVAMAILQYVNKHHGFRYVDPLTVAKRTGIKLDVVREAILCLVGERWLSITIRRGATDVMGPMLRDDCGNDKRSTPGDKAFYAMRDDLINMLVFDRELTPATRLVGLGIIASMDSQDDHACRLGHQDLATLVSVPRKTVQRAIPVLAAQGYFSSITCEPGCPQHITVVASPSLPIRPPEEGVGHRVGQPESTCADSTGESRGKLINLIPNWVSIDSKEESDSYQFDSSHGPIHPDGIAAEPDKAA
jgi:hypothetical protein